MVKNGFSNSPYLAHTIPLFNSESILTDIVKVEVASFMYVFDNNQAPSTFDKLFKRNNEIHQHNTRQCHKYRVQQHVELDLTSFQSRMWDHTGLE